MWECLQLAETSERYVRIIKDMYDGATARDGSYIRAAAPPNFFFLHLILFFYYFLKFYYQAFLYFVFFFQFFDHI